MSGVIDASGVQWEHCHGCNGEGTPDYSERGKWVDITKLCFERPTEQFPCGRDLCSDCAIESVEQGKSVDLAPDTFVIPAEAFKRPEEA